MGDEVEGVGAPSQMAVFGLLAYFFYYLPHLYWYIMRLPPTESLVLLTVKSSLSLGKTLVIATVSRPSIITFSLAKDM